MEDRVFKGGKGTGVGGDGDSSSVSTGYPPQPKKNRRRSHTLPKFAQNHRVLILISILSVSDAILVTLELFADIRVLQLRADECKDSQKGAHAKYGDLTTLFDSLTIHTAPVMTTPPSLPLLPPLIGLPSATRSTSNMDKVILETGQGHVSGKVNEKDGVPCTGPGCVLATKGQGNLLSPNSGTTGPAKENATLLSVENPSSVLNSSIAGRVVAGSNVNGNTNIISPPGGADGNTKVTPSLKSSIQPTLPVRPTSVKPPRPPPATVTRATSESHSTSPSTSDPTTSHSTSHLTRQTLSTVITNHPVRTTDTKVSRSTHLSSTETSNHASATGSGDHGSTNHDSSSVSGDHGSTNHDSSSVSGDHGSTNEHGGGGHGHSGPTAIYHSIAMGSRIGSISILSLLTIWIIFKVACLRKTFFKSKLQVIDASVVLISLGFDVAFLPQLWTSLDFNPMVDIILLGWRVIRVVNNFLMILSEKDTIIMKKLQHTAKKERKRAKFLMFERDHLRGLCRQEQISSEAILGCKLNAEKDLHITKPSRKFSRLVLSASDLVFGFGARMRSKTNLSTDSTADISKHPSPGDNPTEDLSFKKPLPVDNVTMTNETMETMRREEEEDMTDLNFFQEGSSDSEEEDEGLDCDSLALDNGDDDDTEEEDEERSNERQLGVDNPVFNKDDETTHM